MDYAEKSDFPASTPTRASKELIRLPLLDMEIIRLTARYIVANGTSFLELLLSREAGNPQFDFVKPNNPKNEILIKITKHYQVLTESGFSNTISKADIFNKVKLATKRPHNNYSDAGNVALLQKTRLDEQIDWNQFDIVDFVEFRGNWGGEPKCSLRKTEIEATPTSKVLASYWN